MFGWRCNCNSEELLCRLDLVVKQNAELLKLLKEMKVTQQELADKLGELSGTVSKIGAETAKSLTLIQELKDTIANGPPVSAEVQAKVAALEAQLKGVDDLVPDEAPPSP